ncbi:MAG: nucleotidyltransferase domain-containing protein [Prolixibacteraceae bacterium]|nr:nucleotidyltransferase domain-containing protein [Prolixibacteraceae bacterium]
MNYKIYIPLIVEELKKASPEKIILFGSYAYGQPNNESDIDLLIIKDIAPSELRDYRVALKLSLWNLIKNWNVPVDIIVDSQERINQRINEGDLFYKEILTKGDVIYA